MSADKIPNHNTQDEVAFLKLWGAVNGCTLELEGEIGFGRPCVGFTHEGQGHNTHFVSYGYDDYEADPPAGVRNAYHKDNCLAILRQDESEEDQASAIHELYLWCRVLQEKGYRVEVKPRDFGQYEAAGWGVDLLLHGTTAPMLVRDLFAPGVRTEAASG